MVRYRIQQPKARPVDSRDHLPTSGDVLVFLPTGHWVKVSAKDVHTLKRFRTDPFYWAPVGES